jgi:hypothetical protein
MIVAELICIIAYKGESEFRLLGNLKVIAAVCELPNELCSFEGMV